MEIDTQPRKPGVPDREEEEPSWAEEDLSSEERSGNEGGEDQEESKPASPKDPSPPQDDLADQLTQLQGLVREMKTSFSSALSALATVQYGDQLLQEKVDSNRAQYEQQLADVVQMVLALKSEFGGVVGQLQQATEAQRQLQRQVECLQCERDILLEELEDAGSISHSLRQKYHSGQSRPNGLSRANDSSLSILLERARRAFNESHHSMASDHDSGVTTYQHGDASSCGEVTPPSMSPMVQSYIAGLPHGHEEPPLEENYDSDSSLTMAANKSLDMSRSLGDHVAEAARVDSSEEEEAADEVKVSPRSKRVEEQITASTAEKSSCAPESPSPFKRPESPRKVAPHERNSRELARSRVAREILETEQTYCSCLWTVLDHFAGPLRQSGILTHKEVNTIFPPCLGRIYDLHCDLLLKLEDRLANWKWHGVVGDIFARFVDSESELLQLYQVYVNDFPAALQQIRKSCKQSLRFRKFVRKSQLAPCCRGLELPSFLLTPIQRMPRYVLLLKQLLRHTDEDHPDHYHLEASLQRFGSFLTQLNDSIEFSMTVVTAQTTPRPKRKRRGGSSFRSSSMSSYDTMQMSSATRDSGIQSNGESQSSLLLNLAALRDRLVSRHNGVVGDTSIMSLPEPVPQHQPHQTIYESSHNYTFSGSPVTVNGDCVASDDKSNSLPRNGRRRPPRTRRPKSAGVLGHNSNSVAKNAPNGRPGNGAETYAGSTCVGSSEGDLGRPPRPRSMVEPLSGSSFRSQQSSEYAPRLTPAPVEQVQSDRSDSFNSQKNYSLSPEDLAFGASIKSLPEVVVSQSTPSQTHAVRRSPRIPKDYGIYGDNDDIMEDVAYQPTTTHTDNSYRRRLHKLGVPRSKSHGNILVQDGSASPSQQQISMALAHSLTEDKLRSEPDISKAIISDTEDNNISTSSLHPEPHRTGNQRITWPNNRDNVDGGRHIDWEDTSVESTALNTAINSQSHSRRNHWRRKKDRQRKTPNDTADLEITKDKKKGSLKDSLKNLFFKKRKDSPGLASEPLTSTPKGSKVVDLSVASDDSHPPVTLDLQTAVADLHAPSATSDPREGDRDMEDDLSPPSSPHKEQAPPREDVLVLEGVAPELQTFKDENGEPCSAV